LQESYITFCSCVPAGLHQIGAEHAYPSGLLRADSTRNDTPRWVELFREIHGKSKAWQIVTALLMQDVPLYAGAKIRAGAKVVDYALDVTHQPLRADATISFQFDTLVISKAANPDSHTPEGIMWRQPRLDRRPTGSKSRTQYANSSWYSAG
jgi:hypothetical protein